MTKTEVEALAEVYRNACPDGVAKCAPLSLTALEAVARAVRAQDAARGGEIPEVSLEAAARLVAEPGDWAPSVEFVGSLLSHHAAQGRTIAALEAAYAGLERTINADTDGKLALRKAHGARDDETYSAFVARLAQERDEAHRLLATRVEASRLEAAESALATLRQAVEAQAENIRKGLATERAKSRPSQARVHELLFAEVALGPVVKALDAIPEEHPDTVTLRDLLALIHGDGGHHEDAVGRDHAVEDAVKVLHALRLDADALRAIRERAKDADAMWDAFRYGCKRAKAGAKVHEEEVEGMHEVVRYLLGGSGPSGGGEKCSGDETDPAGHVWSADGPGLCKCGAVMRREQRGVVQTPTTPPDVVTKWTRLADHPAGCECTECYTSEPTMAQHGWRTNPLGTTAFFLCGLRTCDTCAPYRTGTVNPPPDMVASEASPITPEIVTAARNAVGLPPLSASEPTPEEDWRTLELLVKSEWRSSTAWRSALARLKAEPRRAAEAALEEVAQDFEMLTAGGKISGLDAADAVRRRKAQPARRFVDADEVRRAAEAMRERCARMVRNMGFKNLASAIMHASID